MSELNVFIYCLNFALLASQSWIPWKNEPPDSIPFEKSTDILGWEYLNNTHYAYGGAFLAADTWYPTWANDGNLYTPWTDGTLYLNGYNVSSSSGAHDTIDYNSTTGFATVVGNDASNLTLLNASTFTSSTWPYRGRYPCGSLYYNHTWFYGTYTLNNTKYCGNWCVQGPFVGFRWSTDNGKTWTEPRIKMKSDSDNIFHETIHNNHSNIKYGAPHIIDFGEELKYSTDGMFYIISHGSNDASSNVSWMQGDEIYVARNYPYIKYINNTNYWQFFAGNNTWINGNVSKAMPLFTWKNHTGVVTMTYFNVLQKFIMVVSTPTTPPSTVGTFDTYFLESDSITGPFKYIVYMKEFGPEAYFVNFPSKFLGNNIDENGYYEQYLSYSANYAMDRGSNGIPIGSGYHWDLQKSRFQLSKSFVKKLVKNVK